MGKGVKWLMMKGYMKIYILKKKVKVRNEFKYTVQRLLLTILVDDEQISEHDSIYIFSDFLARLAACKCLWASIFEIPWFGSHQK